MHPTNAYCEALGIPVPRLEAARHRPDANIYSPLPSPDAPLTAEALDEAWQGWVPGDWSAQRIAICVLDAHDGAMRPEDVLAFVRAHSLGSRLSADSARYWRRGAAIRVRDDGCWELDRAHTAVRAARQAARARVAAARRQAESRPDPAVQEAQRRHFERKRRAHADQLAGMRGVLLHAFPAKRPEALVLLDVERREITTWLGDEIAAARERLVPYEILAAG